MRGAADLHLRAIRLIDSSQRIVMVPATTAATTTTTAPATTAVMALMITITSPHALVLSVSHGSPVADSCLQRLLPRRFVHPTSTALSSGPRLSAWTIQPARDLHP